MSDAPNFTNSLIHAQSPYLLQHAHNPVNWMEWGKEAWDKAKNEDKLVLVSIGYASCHWCHVMEHESFENEDTAAIMNEYFVCIKVDREERPDVDQIYMDAVQLITGHGGWPLNMFCLPDGKPIHGGTYFPNRDWNQLLFQLNDLYLNRRQEALDYGQKLTEGVVNMDVLKSNKSALPAKEQLNDVLDKWSKQFDWTHGGNARTPKFPLPVNFNFLLNAGQLFPESEAKKMLCLTLDKMAFGGIYDQLQGGFARYSVDAYWKVPHFEKMLYDNGQLISLYAKAAGIYNRNDYAAITRQCISFMDDEWKSPEGLYYSSYDADSEGEEGTYYVWTWEELSALPDTIHHLFTEYYTCTASGNWEHGKNILHATMSIHDFSKLKGLDAQMTRTAIEQGRAILHAKRTQRIMPALDNKCILAWNALALEGLSDAARYLNDDQLAQKAIDLASAIEAYSKVNGKYYRIVKNGKASIPAFLEDLSALCSAYISLYQVCFDEKWLLLAKEIAEEIIQSFMDEETGLFYFISHDAEPLIARKKDLSDDVLPGANSTFALCLMKLHHYFAIPNYQEIAQSMLEEMSEAFLKHSPWYSHWGQAYLLKEFGLYQLCVGGPDANQAMTDSTLLQIPNIILAAADKTSKLPILQNRIGKETNYYLCMDETCFSPEQDIMKALSHRK